MNILQNRKKFDRIVKKSSDIFLMAHKDLDLDALGSCVGLNLILKKKKKNCYIIIDDKKHELGVEKVLRELEGCIKIIKSENIEKYLNPKETKNLLVILDTNKSELVQNQNVLKKIEKKVVIDHHDLCKKSIKDAFIINDTEVSSTCEMITKLIEISDINLEPYYATVLLAGIVLDTNNFTLKTTPETYYSAYYLSSMGASAKKVQYLLKQDLMEYTERQKLLSTIQIINGKIAFTKASSNSIYRREDLAKVADTLLFFNDIELSFVIAKTANNITSISGRSIGKKSIANILSRIGGGGDKMGGAAQFENLPISKVSEKLNQAIKEEEQ